MQVLLDVSRLLACGRRKTPSGIDRVEAAYVRRWLDAPPEAVTFVAPSGWGDFAAVARPSVAAMLAALDESWAGGPGHERAAVRAGRIGSTAQSALIAGLGRGMLRKVIGREPGRTLLLSVSHHSLERREPIARLREAGVAFVPLVHDLIPATHPEYARPGDAARHLRRIVTVSDLADGVIVNSAATAAALRPHLVRRSGPPPVLVAPLGIEVPPPPSSAAPAGGAPYFVTIGTIEPRKNHLLLLHLWREFATRRGPAAPRLLLVGRRGWENENVLDLLDRCALLRGVVEEAGHLSDSGVAALLRGARALLFPSFAEGYGLPLAEALAMGVPALCSDIDALREVGGDAPDYLDPLDGAGWRTAILDYAEERSAARAAQRERLRRWRAPGWGEHFARVDRLLAQVAAAPPRPAAPLPTGPRPALVPAIRSQREPAWGANAAVAAGDASMP